MAPAEAEPRRYAARGASKDRAQTCFAISHRMLRPIGASRVYNPPMRYHHAHHHRPPIQPTFDELLARVRDLPEGYRGQILDGAVHVCEPPCAARAHTLGELSATLVAGSPLGDPVPAAWTFLS